MDLTTTPTHTTSNTTTNTASTKSPEPEPEPEPDTPTRIQTLAKPISFSNGVLKRHHHHPPPPPPPPAVTYRECLKNHAASLGGHALDGCGEFMPSPAATPADPTSIKCAACGCHRNFHRRDPDYFPHPAAAPSTQVIEYQPHHRHLPPPPHPLPPRSPDSASPPPISSSYYGHPAHPHHHRHRHHHHSTAPHVLLSLSTAAAPEGSHPPAAAMVSPISRKRFRTKFTQVQKERMLEFAERVGWKIQKRDEDIIQELCHEIGVERGVLKVWMHNNKNRSSAGNNINVSSANDTNINSYAATENYDIPTSSQEMKDEANGGGDHHDHHHHQNHNHHHVGTNGSSSP